MQPRLNTAILFFITNNSTLHEYSTPSYYLKIEITQNWYQVYLLWVIPGMAVNPAG